MPVESAPLNLHPDRLLPVDPAVRSIAAGLYDAVRTRPIISPHGHVDPTMLLENRPFADPTSLLLQPDHYVTRLLHANGVPLADLGVGQGPLPEPLARKAWRLLCANWRVFRGTPVRYWFDSELGEIFGITQRPSAANADALYDRISERLAEDAFRPQALLRRFGIDVLATTDDPADDLAAHQAIAADPAFPTRVIPTFRPDRYLEPAHNGWIDAVKGLGAAAQVDVGEYAGYIDALQQRRQFFISQGATSADHSHLDAVAEPLELTDAQAIYHRAMNGRVSAEEATAFRRHMIMEMARMSCDDGLVMTLHPGVYRNHHPATSAAFGPDTGHDIPVAVEYTRALQPLLERYGTHPNLHLVLFTVDADVFSREVAPLAGFYPAVYAGAPWWFLDNPSEIAGYQRSVTEIAGFGKLSGFIDDTRAFCSIPARHDMSRRLDAAFVANLVATHRLDEDEAVETVVDLVAGQPRKVFKLSVPLRHRDSEAVPAGAAVPRLSRAAGDGRPAAPVRIVHLGLGNFFRAHQAWYTDTAPDANQWGIAAFTGRSTHLSDALTAQDGLYTLITRGADGDAPRVLSSVSRAHAGSDMRSWLEYLADPQVRIVTLTVTEAGYLRGADGSLDVDRPELRADLAALREDLRAPVLTTPARLVAGLAARRAAGAGPLTVVPCDNLPDNGAVTARVVIGFATLLDHELTAWITGTVSFVTTMVDRITPATTDDDTAVAEELTGRADAAPVVTEPYTEWVLAGDFPGGRPAWEDSGARFVEDITPFEERKLWLLNGGHSLLAYAGSARGHDTIAEAVTDPVCREWLEQWWAEASAHLSLPAQEVAAYREALLTRFANPRIRHLLGQIAADGSLKIPVRILPTVRRERAAGRLPVGALRVIAAWVNHLRGAGAPVKDVAAQHVSDLAAGSLPEAVTAVLGFLDGNLAADPEVIDAVVDLCERLAAGPSVV
jgi:glucuronate isomerase